MIFLPATHMLAYPPEFAQQPGYEGGRFLMRSALDPSRMIDSIVFCPTAGFGLSAALRPIRTY
jgi:hypothetical protein